MWRFLLLSVPVLAVALAAAPTGSDARSSSDPAPVVRIDEFVGWWHDVGQLHLHISNRGRFGRTGGDAGAPSAEWPAGSGHEHLYGAGFLVGGVVGADTLVTSGLYQFGEFFNHETVGCGDPPRGICESAYGAPGGLRFFNDDGDDETDEDRLDGKDNDLDGLFDEDFAAISDEMFATEYWDSSTVFNDFVTDPENLHQPLGLHVVQETYAWSSPEIDDFVGLDLVITNASNDIDGTGWEIENVYVGVLVDGDIGLDNNALEYWMDDHAGYLEQDVESVRVRMAYMYDENGGANGADNIDSFLGILLLDQPVHAFRVWSGGDQDPRNDADRYRILRGDSDETPTIDPRTTRANDYRFVVSAGPFGTLGVGESITVRFAFVCGFMIEMPDPQGGGVVRVPDLWNPAQAQAVYNGIAVQPHPVRWAPGLPPSPPGIRVTASNGAATIEWDDLAESPDPVLGGLDFAGYAVERSDAALKRSADGWRQIAWFARDDLDGIDTGVSGLGRYLWEDRGVQNFRPYWYRVRAADHTGLSAASLASRTDPAAETAAAPAPIRAHPNPVRLSGPGEHGAAVRFTGLPPAAEVRIFSVEGRLVAAIAAGDDRAAAWRPDAAGVYLYRVATPAGAVRDGKLVVLR